MCIAENLLKGSIATEADSQLSWSGGGVPERIHPTVVRFASDEEDDLADDNEEVIAYCSYSPSPSPFILFLLLVLTSCLQVSTL